jgi:hypothetical protein
MVFVYSHVFSFSISQQYRLSQHRVHPRQKIGGALRHAKNEASDFNLEKPADLT